ncbi:MAG: DUF4416 family protein [Nitrospiraceae bacterium]|nr:DUF4416 family protein [Nitrospiraceae bacterium]
MAKIKSPAPALLFCGILYSDETNFIESKELLIKLFGYLSMETQPYRWNYSDHYKEEMGLDIMRTFLFFEKLINPGELAEIKTRTNKIEEMLSVNNRRKVNIDPGYLTLHNVVLATTKNYSHRIYIGKGIYAETTLIYKKGETYIPSIFTYSDYQNEKTVQMFEKARELVKKA